MELLYILVAGGIALLIWFLKFRHELSNMVKNN